MRDADILEEMAKDGLVSVAVSITTLDNELKRRLEPRAPSAAARINAISNLSERGVPVSLLVAPVIPALNDAELERIVELAADAGASQAGYILLRLPLEVKALFHEWLTEHYPLRAAHVISLLRQCREGKDNDSRFGLRMRGTGPFADLLSNRFRRICRKCGLQVGEQGLERTDLFDPAALAGGTTGAQISLFD